MLFVSLPNNGVFFLVLCVWLFGVVFGFFKKKKTPNYTFFQLSLAAPNASSDAPDPAEGSNRLPHFEAPRHSQIYIPKYVDGAAPSVLSPRRDIYRSVQSLFPVALRSRQSKRGQNWNFQAKKPPLSFQNRAWAMEKKCEGTTLEVFLPRDPAFGRRWLCRSPLYSPPGFALGPRLGAT